VRFTRGSTISWLAAMVAFMGFYGAITNTAAKALGDSPAAQQLIGRLAKTSVESAGARAFLGIAFFMFVLVLMAYVASAAGAVRNDEATGYLDNFLVGPVSRQRWLWGRIGLIVGVVIVASLLIPGVIWLALGSQHHGLTGHDLLLAGLNAVPAAVFTLGVGIFALGFAPRFTTLVTYGVIAWSFIVQLLASGTKLNHWLLDTSVFAHVAFAPAADPRWGPGWVFIALGACLALTGALAFNRRDLASE
jgi:ABC-2 type transport system permease protein